MLTKRIIPCLDVKEGRVVKGIHFVNLRDAGDPVEQAREYDAEGADELTFLDINASYENRGALRAMVERVADALFIPFTVGGGVRTADDFRALLLSGADKVSINTGAIARPELVNECAEKFGSQCVVVAIDARREGAGWRVVTHGGRRPVAHEAVAWAREVAARGAGELLLTSIDRDGTQSGYDLELLRQVSAAVNLPVIASGGAGELAHFYDALAGGGADAVLAASLFHDRQMTILQVKTYLRDRGLPVRM